MAGCGACTAPHRNVDRRGCTGRAAARLVVLLSYSPPMTTPASAAASAASCSSSAMSGLSSPPAAVKNLRPLALYGRWLAVIMTCNGR